MQIKNVNINTIKPYDKNPRKNDAAVDKVMASLKEFGFKQPIVTDKDGIIIAGHTRYKASLKLGLTEVPVLCAEDLTPEQVQAYRLADNKTAEFAEWDMEMLAGELGELAEAEFDMVPFGFEQIDDSGEDVKEDNFDAEAAAENITEPITKLGDVWKLGRHRLMCGDSTDKEMVDKLLGGVVADICFTSPPYNAGSLNIDGNETTQAKYNSYDDNKTEEEYYNFISTNVKLMIENAKEVFYNIGLVENNKRQIILLLNEFIAQFKDIIYWKKSTVAPHIQSGIINNLVEFILCFGNGKRKFENAQFSQGTYWNVIEGPNASGNEYSNIHKATFPIYLPSNIIENFSPKNGTVVDCFGGTGTTLIACEQLNRTCYMMELDPKYCDVIIQRWEEFTSKKAELIGK